MTDGDRRSAPGRQSLAGIGRNFLAVSAGNLLSRGINFLAIAWIARQLGPTVFGELSWAQASLAFGILFADWGLQTTGIRALARRPEAARRTVSTYLGARIAFAAVAAVGLAAFGFVAAPSRAMAELAALYGLNVLATGVLPEWALTGMHRMGFVGAGRVLQYTCYAALVFLLVRGPGDVFMVPVANATGVFCSAVLLTSLLYRMLPGWRPAFVHGDWRPILSEATPLMASNAVIQVYFSLPILLLGWMRGATAMAYYNSAYRVMVVLHELLVLFLMNLYPAVAQRWSKEPERVGPLLTGVTRLLLLATIPVAAGATVVAGPLMRLIFGAKFEPSVLPFQIMVWNVVLMGMSGVYAQLVLLMQGRERDYLLVSAAGAITSLVCNLVLIPRYGYVGAAAAWVAAEAAVGLAGFAIARRFLRVTLGVYAVKPAAAAAAMAVACRLLLAAGVPVLGVIASGVVIYGGLLVVLRALRADEVLLLKRLLRPSTSEPTEHVA